MSNLSFSNKDDFIKFLKEEKSNKILVICGEKSFKKSGANKLFESLFNNKEIKFYFKKYSIPNLLELQDIINLIKVFSPNLIVSIGGGSVLDYAKMANTLTNCNNLKEELVNSTYSVKKKFAKLVAIPTTAGSGSEATSNAVIYVNKVKYSIEGNLIKPNYIIIDPYLILSTPISIAAASGMDAIAQALESLLSKKSNLNSVQFSKSSLELSLKSFENHINKKSFR